MNKNNIYITIIMIVLFIVALVSFWIIYSSHTEKIESRFDKALENYSLNIQTIMSNTTIDKTVITNESENSITINNEFIINDEIANSFKSTFDINTRMLESSMAEIMKNSNDLLSFWFAFLSVIMIVFTFAGIFINNNILTESKEKLADVNNKANEIIKNIKKQAQTESEQLINSIKKQAEEETKKLIEENNRNIKISNLFNSAYQAYDNKDYNSCINYYDKIIEMTDELLKEYDENSEEYSKYKNNYLIGYNNRGIAKKNLGLNEEAIKDFDKAIEFNPSNSDAYNNRGIAKKNLELYEEAIKDYDKAIELNPNNFMAYYNKGLAKSDLGHNEEAYNDFIEGYKLADDKLKDEYKQRITDLAKQGHEVAKKICNEKNW